MNINTRKLVSMAFLLFFVLVGISYAKQVILLHINDFYREGYGAKGDDVDPPYHNFNCLADFMGTSQDSVGNSNGAMTFYFFFRWFSTLCKRYLWDYISK